MTSLSVAMVDVFPEDIVIVGGAARAGIAVPGGIDDNGGALEPAEQYIDNVISGRQVACRWVRLMCERHRRDLATDQQRGLWFNVAAGRHALDFFCFLRHSKGEWAGKLIELQPWQQAVTWILMGWYRSDGTRRFRTGYLEVARKNGKSTWLAGIGLYMLIADGEPGAEVYSAATKKDQAKILHAESTRMVKASPFLRQRIRVFRDNLHIPNTASKFEPVGRDADSLDGLNVHAALVDELHAHRTSEVWDVLEAATGSRRQPLVFAITTAGFNQDSFCFQQRDYALKVLDGIVEDDSFFGVVFTLDDGDDWTDEQHWIKANPNLGVSVKIDDLRRKAIKARELPSALTNFLTKHLNRWTNAAELWIHPDKWRVCSTGEIDEEGLRGRVCFGGLDLSNTLDLTALVWVFPPVAGDDWWTVLCRFFVPETAMYDRSRNDRVPYDAWTREGYITAIPGEVVDYDWVYDQIDRDAQKFDVQEIGFDRWGAASVYQQVEKRGITMVGIGQGFVSMSPPMKELAKFIVSKRINHGGNPVLAWCAHNLVASTDSAGLIKPDKRKSREKIDGMVALIMALDRATRHDPEGEKSIYETRGVLTVGE